MKYRLVLAQDTIELKFIISKIKSSFFCLPLNLEILVYCEINKIPYINPIDFLNNSIHKNGLVESEKFIAGVKFNTSNIKVVNARHKNLIRNYFNSVFFIKNIIETINKKFKIKNIYVSGWKNNDIEIPIKNYILSDICNSLFKKKVKFVSEQKTNFEPEIYTYELDNHHVLSKKNVNEGTLFLNFGYNFKRILFYLLLKNKKINYICFDKINIFKKLIFRIIGIKYFIFKRKKITQKQIIKKIKINTKYQNKNICELLNNRSEFVDLILFDLNNRCKSVRKLIISLRPKVVFINLVRGVDGYLASLSREFAFNSVCIPHGTVSKSFNKFDKIYKKIITENVFSGDSKYLALQTKIAQDSISSLNIKGKTIKTGNIIFSDVPQSKPDNKKFVLYAVTMKDFVNYQFYGVEMYYEFFKNLKILETLAKSSKIRIVIKPHPSISNLTQDLKKIFPSLAFSNEKIDELLKKTIVTISFSSTVIEDSICSKIPVILFDQWKRYKHCKSCLDVNKKNQMIYYINNYKDITKVIQTIKNSDKFNLSNFLFSKQDIKTNIKQLIKKFC